MIIYNYKGSKFAYYLIIIYIFWNLFIYSYTHIGILFIRSDHLIKKKLPLVLYKNFLSKGITNIVSYNQLLLSYADAIHKKPISLELYRNFGYFKLSLPLVKILEVLWIFKIYYFGRCCTFGLFRADHNKHQTHENEILRIGRL